MSLTRRHTLTLTLATAAALAAGASPVFAQAKMKVAAIYTVPVEQQWVSRIDKALKAAVARGEIEYVFSENVANADYERVMRQYAEQGNTLIVGESFAVEAAARKVAKGLGLSALFSGPPGTGKTMVAGLIADELGLDLYQIDLSRIVSKYVGETEKNLAQLFDAAEAGHAILLFDEADSLFARRTEVKSSVDRYANLEVNYLLQRMEQFAGITILTTNNDTAIDEAFRRRLSFRVDFPMPEADERQRLWQAMVPAEAALGPDIDWSRLAHKFVMSGGYIRNAVLRAAFLAAEDGGAITMGHLSRAAHLEYAAMGKVMSTWST